MRFKGKRRCTRAKPFFIIPRFQVCAQGAAEKNQRKACSFSWRGSVCRIRAYLDMAEMGFLNKGPGEMSPRAAAARSHTAEGFQIRCLPACGVKLSRPTAAASILGGAGNRVRHFKPPPFLTGLAEVGWGVLGVSGCTHRFWVHILRQAPY